MKYSISNSIVATALLLLAITPTLAGATPTVSGKTLYLNGTLKGAASQSWIGQNVAAGSNQTTVITDETKVNFCSVNAWPSWKAQVTFNSNGTFVYYDIDTGNTQANTTPSTPPVTKPGPTQNDNWRTYTGTWKQNGSIVTLKLDPASPTGEAALYRFYGVNTVPNIPASGDGLFAGQAATANVPKLYTGTEGTNSIDYYYTYRKAFTNLGNPAWTRRFYAWHGNINSKGNLSLTQKTIYQISDLQDIPFTNATPDSPATDLYKVNARFILTKKLTSQ